MSQEQINCVLIEQALAGHRVVRLKGGDGFIFGRGGEEIDALKPPAWHSTWCPELLQPLVLARRSIWL